MVTKLGRERLRPDSGGDDGRVDRQWATGAADRRQPTIRHLEADRTPTLDAAAVPQEGLRQPFDQPVRVRGVAVLAYKHALDVIAGQVRIELLQLALREFIPGDAVIAPQSPSHALAFPAGLRAVDDQVTNSLDQVQRVRIARDRRHGLDPLIDQRPQRTSLPLHFLLGPGPDEANEPRCQNRQIVPAHDQRAQWIDQPAGHLANRVGHRHRHHGRSIEAPGIAE